ncbi:MAG: hypothetical protein ACRDZ4_08700 [Egibacteraceae bacterium]
MSTQQGSSGRAAEERVMAALAQLTDRYGADQLQDPGRVRSLLSDQLGAEAVRCRRELNLVLSAAEARTPAALLDDMPVTLDGLASRLAAETGLEHTAAYWAVLAWAAPLGYTGHVTRPAPPFLAAETAPTPPPKATTPPTASTTAPPPEPTQRPRRGIVTLAALAVLLLAAVGTLLTTRNQPNSAPSPSSTGGRPSRGGKVTKIGFLFVGPKDDFGYNQAAYEGSVAVEKAFPSIQVLRAPRTFPRPPKPSA